MFALTVAVGLATLSADPAPMTAKDALQPFHPLIGSWKGTGYPGGALGAPGSWSETIAWSWRFKGDDAWLEATFEKGKYFTRGELRYLPDKGTFQLTLTAPDKSAATFAGKVELGKTKMPVLTLDRTDAAMKEDQRFVLSVLHPNRYLYRFETKPTAATSYDRKFLVGATKEGEPFASVPRGPVCVVSGGTGTMTVTYKGKTYHVCCSGCRDEFNDNPEKYVKAAEKAEKK